jgi:hypothetical protein
MKHRHRLAMAAGVGVSVLAMAAPAAASSWTVTLHAASSAESRSHLAPPAPTGVTDRCTTASGNQITGSWNSVAGATSYSIYVSQTSASSGYTLSASGNITTSYTSAALLAGNYWGEVVAFQGTNWVSVMSAATGETTISSTGCVQP